MDTTIRDTFNAFWALKYGKDKKETNYKLLSCLCEAEDAPQLQEIMKDIMAELKPWIDKTGYTEADYEGLYAACSKLNDKYIFQRSIFPIIAEIYMHIDRRENNGIN